MLFKEHLGRIAVRAVAGLVAGAALASCGGGTYQVRAFVPARILTFGDESNSLIGPQGLKYSINGLSTTTAQIDCSVNPLWTQVLATSYNISYSNCNTQGVASPSAFDFSTLNATVSDVVNQVAAFQSGDSFNPDDLVTIWVGAHDVLNEYQTNGSGDDVNALVDDMRARGRDAGQPRQLDRRHRRQGDPADRAGHRREPVRGDREPARRLRSGVAAHADGGGLQQQPSQQHRQRRQQDRTGAGGRLHAQRRAQPGLVRPDLAARTSPPAASTPRRCRPAPTTR